MEPVQRNKKNLKNSEPRPAKSNGKVTEKAKKKEVNKPPPTKGRSNTSSQFNEKPTTNQRKKSVKSKGDDKDDGPHTSNGSEPSKLKGIKFMSKLKELESSFLNGSPPVAKKTKDSKKPPATDKKNAPASNKKTKGSKQEKNSNKKTLTKSPIAKKGKQQPSASKTKGTSAAQKPKPEKNPKNKAVSNKSKIKAESVSTVKQQVEGGKTKGKKATNKKTKEKDVESEIDSNAIQIKEGITYSKERNVGNINGENTETEKNLNSLLSSDESFMSDSELEIPMGSLSTCLNSIKRQMPRQVGTATPPMRIFHSTNSDIVSDASGTSSFDRVPVKLDDRNIVKRMAKANRPKQINDWPTSSKPPNKLQDTPETLRKMVKIKNKFEKKQDSDVECSSFSDN